MVHLGNPALVSLQEASKVFVYCTWTHASEPHVDDHLVLCARGHQINNNYFYLPNTLILSPQIPDGPLAGCCYWSPAHRKDLGCTTHRSLEELCQGLVTVQDRAYITQPLQDEVL